VSVMFAVVVFVLGFQAVRVFTTQNFWVLGETSDRVILALVVVGVFAAWSFAGVLALVLGLRWARLVAVLLLAGAAAIGQMVADPVMDLFLGAAGTIAFGWVLALSIASLGKAAGYGVALAFAIDVAIRSIFITIDAPFSASPLAAALVLVMALLALVGGHVTALEPGRFAGFRKSLSLVGVGPAMVLFMAFSGNFGQAAAPDAVDLRATMIWVALGAVAGLVWARCAVASGKLSARLHVMAGIGALVLGVVLVELVPSVNVVAVAVLGLGLSVVTVSLFSSDQQDGTAAWAISALTVSGLIFVVLLFVFYSFYGPTWVLPVAVIAVAIPALASEVARRDRAWVERSPRISRKASFWRVPVVCFLPPLLVGLMSGPPSSQPLTATSTDVRVVTYNIRQGFGSSNRFDLEAVARELEQHPAEIIALQEVGRGWVISGGADSLAWLSRRLDMPAYFASTAGDLWGNAVLTSLPVEKARNTHFNLKGRIPRGFQTISAQALGASLTIINTHLDHEDDGATARASQVVRVLESWSQKPFTVLVGDMNAKADTAAMRTLGKAGYRDSNPGGPLTSPSDRPVERIDYIFTTSDLVSVETVTGDSSASDHLLVWARIRLAS
jgi:endonuclease/exonuclease/phosphatase family metal-dependent hydrolase